MFKTLGFCAAAMTLSLATPAQAEDGWGYRLFWFQDEPGSTRYYFDDEADEGDIYITAPRGRQASLYENDLGYYEPQYEPPAKKPVFTKKKPVKPDRKAAGKFATASPLDSPKATAANGRISCEKGVQLVSGYGFATVKPKACDGKVLTFDATRAQKHYEVRVSAATGEITEVRKVP